MPSELILFFTNENGHEQQIAVTVNPFSIGRSEGNDLVVHDAGLSRRHALITFFNDIAQVTDCGSANGTFVNGKQINGNENLKNGDVLTLGQNCKIRVQISAVVQNPAPVVAAPPQSIAGSQSEEKIAGNAELNTPANQSLNLPKTSPLLLASAAVGVIILITIIGITFVVLKKKPPAQPQPIDLNTQAATMIAVPETPSLPAESSAGTTPMSVTSNDPFEKSAVQVIRKISDDSTYPFTPKMIAEIKQRADQYNTANVLSAVKSLESRGQSVANEARNQGIRPELVFYLGLAETNGGQSGDPLNAARQAIPEISFLRAHFGTGQADYALLVIAATRIPGGNKKSHPLLACMRNKVKNPQTDRNIWFLHEAGCLSEGAYDFVLKFLAYSVVAQRAN